jgi:hypothetical protein
MESQACKTHSQSGWIERINQECLKLQRTANLTPHQTLLKGVQILSANRPNKIHSQSLSGQPFDSHLLSLSAIYRRNRQLFLQSGGQFVPSFISSPRTLSSSALLTPEVEFSPIENEMAWAATDPIQKKNPEYLLELRTYATSLFHEQSHRILWTFLPSPPNEPKNYSSLRQYLNFVESLVITLDMSLGDELGSSVACLFHHIGVTYDPGTEIKQVVTSKREYRNYLQAATYATYLNLEGYSFKDIEKAILFLFPNLGDLALRAVSRSCQLDRAFVEKTNPIWQKKYRKDVILHLCGSRRNPEPLQLSSDPLDNRVPYLWVEKWLDLLQI